MTSNPEKTTVYFQITLKNVFTVWKTVAPSGKDTNYNQNLWDSKYAQKEKKKGGNCALLIRESLKYRSDCHWEQMGRRREEILMLGRDVIKNKELVNTAN